MDRLTKRKDYGCACWNGNQDYTTHKRYLEMLEPLCAYEDTGLLPNEVEILMVANGEKSAQITALQARVAELESQFTTARNELCQQCGRYREAHNGACNGCRWKGKNNA